MRMIRLFLLVFLALWLAAAPVMAAQKAKIAPQRTISMDFKNVDLHILIKFISELTGRNFIVDKRVAGRVTAYSPSKLSIEEAYKAFESIMVVNNFAIVATKIENEYKIVPMVEARRLGIPVQAGRSVRSDSGEELITQIIPLKNSSAPELSKLLVNMTDKNGLVSVYNPTNTLIITAPAANIEALLSIIKEVDKGSYASQMETFPLVHGDAKTIAGSISKIMTSKIQEMEKVGKKAMALVEADVRTNSVVALGDPASLDTISDMISALDIPTPVGKDDIHFMSLENADAEDVAKILNELISRQTDKDGKKTKLSKDIKVVADKATNSLIITARPDEFATLEGTIKQLDILRKQVYIEALIMEVSVDSSFSFGVNWAVGGSGGDTSVFGSTNTGGGSITVPSATSAAPVLTFPDGGTIGTILSNAVNIGGTAYSIQSIINLAETNNDYKILATPQLMTLDNEKASVNVVDNIPFSKQTQTSNVNSDYASQSLDYKDVGVKLEITPHIGERGTLRLEVKQEISRVINSLVALSSTQNVIAPTTKKREVETVIQMQDNQTVVIAGLINDDNTNNKAQVPGLGDMPLFGWLFKQKEEKSSATNLFIFITPRIIDTYDESSALARLKKRTIYDAELGADGQGLPKMVMSDPLNPIFIFPEKKGALSEKDLEQ
ncbi:type II secretion system protein GspD [Pseudodesulfovibrio nedwellii]|uniref:Type II secretion system protein GspD n=1 Tax=Pseudodesulfovibrio nedwellii TaxID=2973072 RepID=A0ABN6S823_9BACT|nr:type II secretion system secretin GspD [Pseudodesulfovibrio nedwellii]BDQ38454.1 type II secretion system protein GspD [Pseudodesulfovibrio nedwellii]